jgi:hypothetical protein
MDRNNQAECQDYLNQHDDEKIVQLREIVSPAERGSWELKY